VTNWRTSKYKAEFAVAANLLLSYNITPTHGKGSQAGPVKCKRSPSLHMIRLGFR